VQGTTAVPGVGYLEYYKDTDGDTFCIMEEDTLAA
jgi:predicted enzyme related to lactoylglutathione lyase